MLISISEPLLVVCFVLGIVVDEMIDEDGEPAADIPPMPPSRFVVADVVR